MLYKVNTEDPGAPLSYCRTVPFAGNHSKFTILQDSVSGLYYSIISRIRTAANTHDRNLLSLIKSEDGIHWELARDLIDLTDRDPHLNGVQYVDFIFDGEDILYLCRTAVNQANSYHNSNAITFHKISDFRSL